MPRWSLGGALCVTLCIGCSEGPQRGTDAALRGDAGPLGDADANTSVDGSPNDGAPASDVTFGPRFPGGCVVEVDRDGDDATDNRIVNTYDGRGLRIVTEESAAIVGSSTVPRRERLAYDGAGNLLRVELDDRADGTVEMRYTHTYDAQGHQLTSTLDDDGDGEIDRGETREYDDAGRVVFETWDDDGNGVADSSVRTSYDSQGRQTGWMRDPGEGGTHNGYAVFGYDAGGRRELDTVYQANGAVELRQTYSYEQDDLLVRVHVDFSEASIPDYQLVKLYDDAENLVREDMADAGGTVTQRTSWAYAADKQLLSKIDDYNYDGTPDKTEHYTYDAHGNLLRYERDDDGDGDADWIEVSSYDCW